MKYQLSRAMQDYTLSELVKGTDSVLTEHLPLQITRPSVTEDIVQIHSGKTDLWLDESYGELIGSNCDCRGFFSNGYVCGHVTALLIQYLMNRDGYQSLEGTMLEKTLAKKTGVQHPFTPGILRKTDRRITNLTRNFPAAEECLVQPGQTGPLFQLLSAEYILKEEKGMRLSLSVKAGPKKHYIIKSIREFLNSYHQNQIYPFSEKMQQRIGRQNWEEPHNAVLDYLYRYYRMYQNTNRLSEIFSWSKNTDAWIILGGRDLDSLMELLDGTEIKYKNTNGSLTSLRIMLSESPSPLCLVRENYGATLKIPEQQLLASGFDYLYLKEEDRILRVSQEQWDLRNTVSDLSGESGDLYIQDQDLQTVCTSLLPLIGKDNQLTAVGMDLTDYIPETPAFQFYLDYPQDDLICCEVFACYTRHQGRYNLYDQETDIQRRNLPVEHKLSEELAGLFSAYDNTNRTLCLECDEKLLYSFLTETVPLLSEAGEVMISDRMKKLRVRRAGEMAVGIQVEAGSLLVSLGSAEMDRSEIAEVLSSYDRKKNYTRLKNGEFIVFDQGDEAVWEALSETYRSYGKKNPEAMKVPMFRALYLDELLKDRDEVALSKGDEYQKLLLNLRQNDPEKYQIPDSLKEILRPYQQEGMRWICTLKDNGFGGILADDMGLGKTLQVLSFLQSEKERGKSGDSIRTLIISPASLIYNWQKEIETFTPQLNAVVVAGNAAQRKKKILEGTCHADVVITSYDLLKRDIADYEGISFANEIIDEAQYIKNQNTQTSKGVRLVNSQFRLALTGTPIENRLSELWSIFDYLMPGFLYSYSRFRGEYESPVVNDHDEKTLDRLRRMVHPFILRRLKQDVLKDLPEKMEETVTIGLEGEQRKLYDAHAQRLRLYLDRQSDEDFRGNKLEILAELTKLRQICCGPELFLETYQGENAKKEACLELVRQAIEGRHKVLIFSQFTSVLDGLCESLTQRQIPYHRIDGSVSKEDRIRMVDSFDTDEVPVFCISLRAGGTGLNLTAADIVIHYDPWWNLAAQNQATDRTHRIGQTHVVTVYQLIAEHTIEESIQNMQQSKARLAEDILSGGEISSTSINREDLLRLLQ